MKVSGKLLKIKGNTAYIEQFMTGAIYSAKKEKVEIENKNGKPVKIGNLYSVRVRSENLENVEFVAWSKKEWEK